MNEEKKVNGIPADQIDKAIEATDNVPTHYIVITEYEDKTVLEQRVPLDFTSSKFEEAVAVLYRLRVQTEQRKRQEAEASKILLPDHKIVGVDGKRLS